MREARFGGDGTYAGKVEWGAMYSSLIGGELDSVTIHKTRAEAEADLGYYTARGANTRLVKRTIPDWDDAS